MEVPEKLAGQSRGAVDGDEMMMGPGKCRVIWAADFQLLKYWVEVGLSFLMGLDLSCDLRLSVLVRGVVVAPCLAGLKKESGSRTASGRKAGWSVVREAE